MFKKEFNKSIRFQFLSVMSIIIFLSTVVLSTVIALNEEKRFEYSLMTKGQSFASYIAKLSTDPLVMKDYLQLESLVNEANKDKEIAYTLIRDPQGNLITSQYASINYMLPRLQAVLSGLPRDSGVPDIISAIKKREAVIELSAPIRTGDDTIGAVTIGMLEYEIHQQIARTILFVIVLNLIVAFILGAVLFVASKKIVLTPITGLARAASRLATGDLSTRVSVESTGEILTLVNSFNRMAGDLEKTTVSRNYVDNIIGSMRDALLVASPDGAITRVNAAACVLLGYDEAEFIGKPIGTAIADGPREAINTLAMVLQNGSVKSVEKTFRTKNGKDVPVLFSASVMRDPRGDVQGIVFVAQDITARKHDEEMLRAYSADLREVNEELKSFAYIVSHDLRAPLVNIKGFSEELIHGIREIGPVLEKYLDGFTREERRQFSQVLSKDIPEALGFIGSSVIRMDNLINAILKLSRAGRHKLVPEPVSAQELVRTIVNSLAHQIGTKSVRVSAEGLPDVVADSTALEQIFGNLLDNAVKYLEPGRAGEIEVSAERNQDEFIFHVRDNGRGMAKEDIPRAFEIFRRVGSQDVPGEGMGLAYVKALVRLHGGRIWCESEPGRGTTFSFSLPVPAGDSGEPTHAGGRP